MAHLIENQFSSYELTDDETLQGSILSILHRQVIQNHLAFVAMEKNALEFDPCKPEVFAQQEAYKKGQLDILSYILDSSVSAIEAQEFKVENPEL